MVLSFLSVHRKRLVSIAQINASKSISVHFRRGDYKKLHLCHPILPDDYYAEAIHYILSQGAIITHIYYYCEDEDAADIENVICDLKTLFSGIVWWRMKTDAHRESNRPPK